MLEYVLKRNPLTPTKENEMLLHTAVKHGNVSSELCFRVVHLLLQKGINPNATDNSGKKALDYITEKFTMTGALLQIYTPSMTIYLFILLFHNFPYNGSPRLTTKFHSYNASSCNFPCKSVHNWFSINKHLLTNTPIWCTTRTHTTFLILEVYDYIFFHCIMTWVKINGNCVIITNRHRLGLL